MNGTLGVASPTAAIPRPGSRTTARASASRREVGRGERLAAELNNLGDALAMLGRMNEALTIARGRLRGGARHRAGPLGRRAGAGDGGGVRAAPGPLGRRRGAAGAAGWSAAHDDELRLAAVRLSHRRLRARQGDFAAAEALERRGDAAAERRTSRPQSIVSANTRARRARAACAATRRRRARSCATHTQTIRWGDIICYPSMLLVGVQAEADLAERARAATPCDASSARAAPPTSLLTVHAALGYGFERPVAIRRRRRPAPCLRRPRPSSPASTARREAGCGRRAAERWERLGFPYPAADARLREAEARLAAGGDRAAAASALRAAHAALTASARRRCATQAEALARRARIALEPRPAERPFDLTDRELTVLERLAAGRTNRQIADELYLSTRTVDMHVRNLLSKLGAANRVEAANTAHRLGLVQRYGSPAVAAQSRAGVASAHVPAPARAGLPPHPPGRAGVRRRRRPSRRPPPPGPRLTAGVERELDCGCASGVADAGIPGASAAIVFPDGRMWSGAAGDAVVKPRRPMTPATALPFDSITKTRRRRRSRCGWSRRAGCASRTRSCAGTPAGAATPARRSATCSATRRARATRRRVRSGRAASQARRLPRRPKPGPRTDVGRVLERRLRDRGPRPRARRARAAGSGAAAPRVRPSGRRRPRVPAGRAPAAAARALLLVSATAAATRSMRATAARSCPTARSPPRSARPARWPATSPSLARWGHELFEGRVLRPASLREMTRFRPGAFWEAYGLGLARDSFEDRTMWGHGGDGLGSHTEFWHLPRERLTLAVTWNDDLLDREGGLHTMPAARRPRDRLARLRARSPRLELPLDLRDLRAALRRLRVGLGLGEEAAPLRGRGELGELVHEWHSGSYPSSRKSASASISTTSICAFWSLPA